MKKKNKHKARKSITAVGAVVAAGLTPGLASGSQAPELPGSDMELTAADAVSIDGDVFDFDDLYVMNPDTSEPDQIVVVYGSRPPKKDKTKKKEKDKDKKIREQQIADSLMLEEIKRAEEDARARAREEAMRRDSIQRAIKENHKLVYGPPPPRFSVIESERLREIASNDKVEARAIIGDALTDFVYRISNSGNVPLNVNIISDLKMDAQQLEALSQEIENNMGVVLTSDMIKQLGTLERIANFIVEVVTPIKKED